MTNKNKTSLLQVFIESLAARSERVQGIQRSVSFVSYVFENIFCSIFDLGNAIKMLNKEVAYLKFEVEKLNMINEHFASSARENMIDSSLPSIDVFDNGDVDGKDKPN